MATRYRGDGTGSAAAEAFLDDFAREVLDELDAAAAPPLHPDVSSVCAEADALARRLNADDGSASIEAYNWLDTRGRTAARRGLGGRSARELDVLNGCFSRVESALARFRRRRRGATRPRGPPPGLGELRAAVRRRLRSLGFPLPWPGR